ncbi:MAG: hypothetical protein A2268_08790 [Candidatus Raymondbacteria bacterium RifOxyA12_full_50_37]|uniref:STAS domain-containing protein n=1 Tax=Candidatus Raymondbacteria bacterium RIFOXYD12_FULL_49_13 TaxID=1817890 RepID=A0A1F7FG85_UNCRA|nr:MAG: hypothetical protein A2350_19710 [Candidatus Raymondbacteria bacterium RifOxyB12_full_50_8]OGJ91589.1 MAG: hypothetical protein A2268_08790 [Candidatus Raymondbacteria bacterium RifOxyA12_full_50_37]OGJ92895.1 MAG: hypothetical protein A2248_08490 [Candidatus Raymondbacteria bacterium RIFOXYA2_FULL_49_16]OGJ94822.1 MAG: hypothetical protein A2487_03190 [Candidatus Raymondbacteria bacterium RifOxyC12_full_50_8]OGK05719.1 MAG: hypothetical protein A2519_03980 [Candidatus Raymondbacteria b
MPDNEFSYKLPAEITFYNSNELIEMGVQFLTSSKSGNMRIDLADLILLNSMTIGALIKLHNMAEENGRAIILDNVSEDNLKVLETTSLVNFFTVHAPSIPYKQPERQKKETLSLKLDFDLFQNVGVFKFSDFPAENTDCETYITTLDTILNDEFKTLIDISRFVSACTITEPIVKRLQKIVEQSKGRVRIFCSDAATLQACEKHISSPFVTIYPSREKALGSWN